jgi:hypothetical protein
MMRAKPERNRTFGLSAVSAAVALLMLAGWTVSARAAALKAVSAQQFGADVARLRGLVAACAGSAAACNSAQVGEDEQVGDLSHSGKSKDFADGDGFAMHWQWLRDSLEQAKHAKNRQQVLSDAAAQLEAIARESGAATSATQQGFAQARTAANAVLARGEFQAINETTWWDRQKAKLMEWLGRIFYGVDRLGSGAPWIGRLLEWLLFVGAAVGLLFFLLRNAARQRLRVAIGDGAAKATAWERESTGWAQMAESHAAAGEWRDAVHCLYWAAIVLLEARRAWRHNPARTPREYVRLLRAGSGQQRALRGLTRIFERVWYGLREADAEEYASARRFYDELAAGAESAGGAATGAAAAGVA